MYGLDNLDEKIYQRLQRLDVKSNFFIEAGANDGLTQSNTAMLEFNYGWKGILVEPNFENYQKAQVNRPNSKVYRGALVSRDYPNETINGIFSTDSITRWNGLCSGVTKDHLAYAPQWISEVPAITLDQVLTDCNAPNQIGLLSLDVEDYELEVMRGLDTEVWRPHVIVMEVAKHYDKEILESHINYMKSIDYFPDDDFDLTAHDFIFIDSRKR